MESSETSPVRIKEKYGESLTYDPQFSGPVKSRSCTDLICLFLFIAFLAGWAVVAFFAYREGDPRILLYPTDSDGNICGVGNFEKQKFLYYFDLLKCASPSVILSGCPTPQVCVEKCPNETFHAASYPLTNPEELKSKLICKYNVSKAKSGLESLINNEDCAQLYLKSRIILYRCIPEIFLQTTAVDTVYDSKKRPLNDGQHDISVDEVKNATRNLAKFLSFREFGEKIFSDFKTSWKYIVAGLLLSMLVSLIWIVLMRWIAGIMIWLSIFVALGFLLLAWYYSISMYKKLKEIPGSDAKFEITINLKSYLALKNTWLVFAVITGSVFVVLLLILLFLRKRIVIAIALIKEASRAVGCMVTSLIFPIVPYILMVIFFAVWVTIALYIASSGKAAFKVVDAPPGSNFTNGSQCHPKDFNATKEGIKCLFATYGLKENVYTAHAYNLFGLFWGLFFAVGVGQVSLAGAFASYYWTLDKKNVRRFAVLRGFCHCICFHMGSIAFGSLLIATVRFISVLLEYINQKCKKYDNAFVNWLMWCMRCCFWCLENLLRFTSKNAYIMIAIYGKNFCQSAREAFMLLMRNIVRVVVLDKITDFLLFLGKLVVVAFAATSSFYIFNTDQKIFPNLPPMNYNLLPPIWRIVKEMMVHQKNHIICPNN